MKGVVLFAFNNNIYDYYKMAVYCAKRVNRFLDLPVTIVTDKNSVTDTDYVFDNIIYTDAQTDNLRANKAWYNKGRYRVFDYSPYDETLVIDTDYLVNSNTLNSVFNLYDDFMCHKEIYIPLFPKQPEYISPYSFETLWATVMFFRKTNRVKQLFECMQMIQENYVHYVNLYGMLGTMFRNDHALAIATRLVNGHFEDKSMYIPWSLTHIQKEVTVYRVDDTSYLLMRKNGKRNEYITVKDIDFHCLGKQTFMDLINE